jgi:hypothetical protein
MTKLELLDAITELAEEKAILDAKLAFLQNELDEGNYEGD